jgi:hypothetical protein
VAATSLAVIALRLANPAHGSVRNSAVAARSVTPAAVVKPSAIPFTRVDVLLLVTGGGMLLALGSAIGRVRNERSSVVDLDGDA